jgi:hypothetical protein
MFLLGSDQLINQLKIELRIFYGLNFEINFLFDLIQVSFGKASIDLNSFDFLCQLGILVSCGNHLFLFVCSQYFEDFNYFNYMISQGLLFDLIHSDGFFCVFQYNFKFLFLNE